jgi:hypothetical protein
LSAVADVQLKKLKSEINGLVGKIAVQIRRENEFLKNRITLLERENVKLINLLYGTPNPVDIKKFFRKSQEKNIVN